MTQYAAGALFRWQAYGYQRQIALIEAGRRSVEGEVRWGTGCEGCVDNGAAVQGRRVGGRPRRRFRFSLKDSCIIFQITIPVYLNNMHYRAYEYDI